MTRSPRVLVVGSSNTDLVVRTPRIPAPGETVLGGDLLITPGGKGANQAVAAARLGAEVRFLARIGTDMFGDHAVESIRASGVSTEFIIRDSAAPSGVALICVDDRGENIIVVSPGSNARLTPEDVRRGNAAFTWADIVLLQLEIPLDTAFTTVEVAQGSQKRIVLTPAPVPDDVPFSLFTGVDVLIPNEHESRMIIGYGEDKQFDAERDARDMLRMGVRAAVITLGAAGALGVDTDSCVHRVPGVPVTAVDATAAGDCFAAALSVALAEQRTLAEAMLLANSAAAISVTRKGAQASLPTRVEADEMWTRQLLAG